MVRIICRGRLAAQNTKIMTLQALALWRAGLIGGPFY